MSERVCVLIKPNKSSRFLPHMNVLSNLSTSRRKIVRSEKGISRSDDYNIF